MRVSGFTFLKNAEINGYPFIESIQSILPLVDEFICVIGASSDRTLTLVEGIGSQKIKIVQTVWNPNMRDRGFVYGQQKMIGQYMCTGDWIFYLEGDEVLHESEISNIRDSMQTYVSDDDVEALYFNFFHFYGTPQQYGIAGYRQAPRILKNSIRSYAPDGLFWVVMDRNKRGRYPSACSANANIYHYGHCRLIEAMRSKNEQVGQYWGRSHPEFAGYGDIDLAELRPFIGTHPALMSHWIENKAERTFRQSAGYKLTRRDRRNRLRFWFEDLFGLELSKKHFRRLD